MFANPAPYQDALSRFRFTGIDTMRQRIASIRSTENALAC
jgi:hypothetical protein